MKKYNALIVDDEKNVRDALRLLLNQNCPDIEVCGLASSAAEAREMLGWYDIDIIFLDISMPREDGFSFIRSIPKEKYSIIFTTAYQEYALKAIKASAVDYLLKPISYIELIEAVEKAIHFHELRTIKKEVQNVYSESLNNLNEQIITGNSIKKITIPEQFGFKIVNVSSLLYLQADSNYTVLHLTDQSKIIATRALGDFEKILDNTMFFRIHKSTIINLDYLQAYSSYQGNYAELTDGTRLTISRRKVNEFREAISQFSHSPE